MATVALESSRRSLEYASISRRMAGTSMVRARRMVTSIPGRGIAGPAVAVRRPTQRCPRPGGVITFGAMTSRISRILIISTAAVVAATGLACGFINQSKGVLEAAKVLGDFADRLEKHSQLTYTAEYQVTGGEKVTLVQQPPNASY